MALGPPTLNETLKPRLSNQCIEASVLEGGSWVRWRPPLRSTFPQLLDGFEFWSCPVSAVAFRLLVGFFDASGEWPSIRGVRALAVDD